MVWMRMRVIVLGSGADRLWVKRQMGMIGSSMGLSHFLTDAESTRSKDVPLWD